MGRIEKEKSNKIKNQSANVRKRHKKEMDWEEWDELAAEMTAIKKARKGKNSRK